MIFLNAVQGISDGLFLEAKYSYQTILPATVLEIFMSVITLPRTTGTVSTVSEDCLLT